MAVRVDEDLDRYPIPLYQSSTDFLASYFGLILDVDTARASDTGGMRT